MIHPKLLRLTKTLVARSDHSAYAYGGRDCTNYEDARYEFECGKACWPTADGWSSIFLQYSGSGAKPTADCFASSDCTGTRVSHNGIENEHTSGCSNQPRQVHSRYLYFNCLKRNNTVSGAPPFTEYTMNGLLM
jgi:hypothetical protein